MSATIHALPKPVTRQGEVIKPVPLPSMLKCQRIARIQAVVAVSYGIRPEHMTSVCCWRDVAWPRQVAMYLAKEITGKPLTLIGRSFGNRDHSTVIHAIRAVEKRMADDPIYRADVEALREALS